MSRSDYAWGLGADTEARMSHEAIELTLYAENDHGCYRAYVLPMLKACQKHYDKGQGDYEAMLRGFTRIGAPIARQYILEHGSMTDKWSSVFPVSVRREFARHMAEYFLTEYRLGNRWS
jgi:hypothetical protein